ncbi:MAG: ATP-binding protein [Desulfobacteraceae bacterium]|nr:ATP-binding protein [Desulfobacteraceae bacterium]
MNSHDKLTDICVPGKRENLEHIKDEVLKSFSFFSQNKKTLSRLELVLEEVVLNICDYAYKNIEGMIEIKTYIKDKNFYIQIKDSGSYFNLLEYDEPDTESLIEERQIGGLGIHFIKKFTQEIKYKREDNKNIINFSVSID